MRDVIEDVVIPEHPTVNISQPINVYVPLASTEQKGIASFDNIYFYLDNGKVGIRPNAIFESNIVNRAVTSDKIDYEAVKTEHIADDAINTQKVLDGAITHDKLASKAVDTDNIKNKAVTIDKIDDSAISYSKLTPMIANNIKESICEILLMKGGAYDGTHLRLRRNAHSSAEDYEYVDLSNLKLNRVIGSEQIKTKSILGEHLSDALNSAVYEAIKNVSLVKTDAGTKLIFYKNDGLSSDSIDLPLDLMVTKGEYDGNTKDIILTLSNGDIIPIPLDDITDRLTSIIDTKFDKFLNPETGEYESQIFTEQIKDDAVTEDKIADDAVTTDKIADDAVTSEKIYDESILYRHLDPLMSQSISGSIKQIVYDSESGDLVASTDFYGLVNSKIPLPIPELKRRIEQLEGLTLTTVIDSSEAYEKVVPTDVGKYAVINKVGGKGIPGPPLNNNMCVLDGTLDFDDGGNADIRECSLGYLDAGTYYLSLNNQNAVGIFAFRLFDLSPYNNVENDGALYYQSSVNFTVLRGTTVIIEFQSLSYVSGGDEPVSMSGKPQIMLCKSDDVDKTYKPYTVEFTPTKPKSIESYTRPSKNLCSVDVKRTYTLEEEWLEDTIQLGTYPPGKYYVRVFGNLQNVYEYNIEYPSDYPISFGEQSNFEIYEVYGPQPLQLVIVSNNRALNENAPMSYLAGTIEGVMICDASEGDLSNVPYEPYSPLTRIQAIEIPESIRNREGYGLSGSYIDFDRKVFVNADGEEEDIAAELTSYEDFLFIEVEPGGTLKFVNEDGTETPVPSTVTYQKKL